jgi:hypothetical protein
MADTPRTQGEKKVRTRRRSVEAVEVPDAQPAPPPEQPTPKKKKKKKKNPCKRAAQAFSKRASSVLNGSSAVLGRALSAVAIGVAFLFGSIVLISGLQQQSLASRDLAGAAMSLCFTGVGVAGSRSDDRGLLMLYFVLVAWSIAMVTGRA